MIRSTFVLFIGLILITVWGCSEDSDNNLTMYSIPEPNDTLIDISGITETGIAGDIGQSDPDDWCVPAKAINEGGLPTEFAFYPAYPNPSYQQMLIHYDLPISTGVDIHIINSKNELIRTLVSGSHPAGAYVTSWDRLNEDGVEVETGIYRVIMAAGDFVCHGDLRLIASSRPSPSVLTIKASISDSILTISYDSPVSVGGVGFIMSYNGTVGSITYGSVAYKMAKYSSVSDQIIRVNILPGITGGSMAAGERQLCTIRLDGSATLHYIDAADYLGDVMKTIIINSP